jgi:hypothetical protein
MPSKSAMQNDATTHPRYFGFGLSQGPTISFRKRLGEGNTNNFTVAELNKMYDVCANKGTTFSRSEML